MSSPSNAFVEQDTVDGGELETALGTYDEPWEDQSWEEPEEAEVLDDDWTDDLTPEDPELEDQSGSLDAVVKCETQLFCWDSDGTRVNSTSFSNTATYTSESADHRERDEVDQRFFTHQHFAAL